MAYFRHRLPNSIEHSPRKLEQGPIFSLEELWGKKFIAYQYLAQRQKGVNNYVTFQEEPITGDKSDHPHPHWYFIKIETELLTSYVIGYLWMTDYEQERNRDLLDKRHLLTDIYGSGIYTEVLTDLQHPWG